MRNTIGYLIPEFPGQTHAFFMRERAELTLLGVQTDLISTRPPLNGRAQHSWAEAAESETTYLAPMTASGLASAFVELMRSGPRGWCRVGLAVARSTGLSWMQKIKLAMFVPVAARLSRIARSRDWQHIHVHSCANALNVAMLANRLSGLKYSLTLHGPLKDYGANQSEKWRHADFGVIITKDLLREARNEIPNALPERIFIAPMGVELRNFERHCDYVPAERTGEIRLISCGRINPCKGHDDLIRAVGLLRQRGLNCRLRICGSTDSTRVDYRDALLALAEELDVSEYVELLGSVSESEVRRQLEDAHFFCLASHKEPLGVATMEAMAMEIPCVVTRSPGVTEMIDDGRDGVLVPAKSPEAFADTIEQLVGSPFRATEIAAAGRATIVRRFHSGVSAEAIRDGVAGKQPENPDHSKAAFVVTGESQ